jgi:RHS repeat-associated protein
MIKEETARAQPKASTCEWRQQKTNRDTGEAWLFQYDALGNLLTVGLPDGTLIEYLVDGMGRRVGKKKNGVLLKQWLYRDELKPLAELDGNGTLVSEFVYGSKSNVPDFVRRGGNTYRVVSDHLGSPRYVVNVANASDVPFTASYTSFGEVTGTGLDWMPFGFAGGLHDGDSRLVTFGARDYAAALGRWLGKDPRRWGHALATNFFTYAVGDPVNLRDDTGADPTYSECNQMALTEANACVHECLSLVHMICSFFGDESDSDCEAACDREFHWQLDACRLTAPPIPTPPKPDIPDNSPGHCFDWDCYAGP